MANDRSILITNGNLLSLVSLADWLRRYGSSIAKIYVTRRLPSERSNVAGVMRMLRRSGLDYTYFKVWLNVVAPRRLARCGVPASVADYVRFLGFDADVEVVGSVNTADVVREASGLAPRWLVSFSATERFGPELLACAVKAAINVHWGALPAYAGLSPYFWHLCNQEPTFGVTLHRMERRVDAGPIIEQATGDTEGARTALEVALRMAELVSPMLCRLFEGTTDPDDLNEQDLTKRSYFGHPRRSEVKRFHRLGFRMRDAASTASLFERVRDCADLPA